MSLLPIVLREMRSSSRKGATYLTRVASVGAGLLAVGILAVRAGTHSNASGGGFLFFTAAFAALLFALVEGIRASADSLSEEKREGTLGLLFLTHLSARDVALGKLAAASLASVLSLLAVMPLLAVPVLMGGVTGGEIARAGLVAVSGMTLALSLGLWASARCASEHASLGLAAAALAAVCLGLPLLDLSWIAGNTWPNAATVTLLSPFYAFSLAADAAYGVEPLRFWASLASMSFLAGAMFLASFRALEKRWRAGENADSGKAGSKSAKREKEARMLESAPLGWLLLRQAPPAGLFLIGVAAGAASGFIAQVFQDHHYIGRMMFRLVSVLCLMTLLFFAAWRPARFFIDSARGGALELILTSPLSAADFARGLRRGLWGLTAGICLCGLGLALLEGASTWLDVSRAGRFFDFSGLLRVAAIGAVLGMDALALAWAGARLGLSEKRAARAAVVALAVVVFAPCILLPPPYLTETNIRGLGPDLSLVAAAAALMAKDAAVIVLAQRMLSRRLRPERPGGAGR